MPRTPIAVQQPSDAGALLARTNGDAVNNHEMVNNGNTLLIIKNGGGASINVTLKYAADKYGRTGTKVVAVGTTEEKVLGPFTKDLYCQPDGKLQFDLSAATSVTIGAVSAHP
ncbi:hypothetical protein [Paenibacillus koleovorans]|uniref:hypothetical protein n=1 Tax=Paenibacillus koleovorans TaxID=121608 RepID=UPI000FD9D069|nr:hypothetical protein [Paenibacillus koleovorans]